MALLAIGGLPWLLWGVFLRVVFGLHCTWMINSVTHIWGNRRFQTRDDSKNSFWVALFTFGEGWHNNHHAYPTSARHGMTWSEVDMSWMQIKLMSWLGLAWDVKVPTRRRSPTRRSPPSRTSSGQWSSRLVRPSEPRRSERGEPLARRLSRTDTGRARRAAAPPRRYPSSRMQRFGGGNRTRSIVLAALFGSGLIAVAAALNVSFIVVNWRAGLLVLLGVLSFVVLVGGLVLNTLFLIREIRRSEQHDALIHAVTHELKTPLASIKLYLQTLRQRDLPPATQHEVIDTMLDDSDRLQRTIDQILLAGKTGDAHRVDHPADVDLSEVVGECVSLAGKRHHW